MIERTQITAWMAAAAEGERAVLEPLFAALWAPAVTYAERVLGDRSLAEDCVQDALVRLFGQLDRFDRARDGLTWALTLVTWSCRTARRRRGREGSRLDASPERTVDGLELAVERDLIRAALATLATLDAADIETIATMIAGATDTDVAASTFRKRLERAVARLRGAWKARHGSI